MLSYFEFLKVSIILERQYAEDVNLWLSAISIA